MPRLRELSSFGPVLLLLMSGLAWVLWDAGERRRDAALALDAQRATVRATGLSDLFLSSGSRWLRHPSLAEPGAATSDAPDGLDVDPAGMAIEGYDGTLEGRSLVVRHGEP